MLGGEGVDEIQAETLPMIPGFGDDNGGRSITEILRQRQRLGVSRDISLNELNTQISQTHLREAAGLAVGRG